MKTVMCDNYENLLGPLPPSDEPCESQKQDREYQKSSRGKANILKNLTPLKVQRWKNVLSSFLENQEEISIAKKMSELMIYFRNPYSEESNLFSKYDTGICKHIAREIGI